MGGGRVIEILKSLMGASGKFYHMTQPISDNEY